MSRFLWFTVYRCQVKKINKSLAIADMAAQSCISDRRA